MAETHKSKYKKPENAKPTYRKDIKDYTLDDKDEKLNPYATGDKIKNVLRKTDKEVVDVTCSLTCVKSITKLETANDNNPDG